MHMNGTKVIKKTNKERNKIMAKIPRLDGRMLQQIARKLHIEKLFKEMEDIDNTLQVIGKGVYNNTTLMFQQRVSDIAKEIQRLAREWGM